MLLFNVNVWALLLFNVKTLTNCAHSAIKLRNRIKIRVGWTEFSFWATFPIRLRVQCLNDAKHVIHKELKLTKIVGFWAVPKA